jgi:ribosomal protein S18 acetylase RimI-like enzyme
MEILPLQPSQKKQAARTVAAAFYDYPSLMYYFPDPKRRTRWLPWYMECVLNCARLFGEVWTTADVSGVLFALPPGRTRLSDADYVRGGLLAAPLVVGLKHYACVSACEATLADTQERLLGGRAHYYLWGLAVDPGTQRSGAGSALLDAFLRKTDAAQTPVYLETHRESNVPYYEQRGFTLIGKETVPKHNQDFWCLLHEPD